MSEDRNLTPEEISAAADLLIEARRFRRLLDGIPASIRPRHAADAHAIQDAVRARLGGVVGAVKVNAPRDGEVFRGILEPGRVVASPARVDPRKAGMMGIEAEIAFRFPFGVPAGKAPLDYDTLASMAEALPVFDVVDTRLSNFMSRSQPERIADALNAGYLVYGQARRDWRGMRLSDIDVRLTVDGQLAFDDRGRHPLGDPFMPIVRYLGAIVEAGCAPGTVITTGSYTGLTRAEAGQRVRAAFDGFEPIEVQFVSENGGR